MSDLARLPIGISTTFDYGIPFAAMCRMIADAGFKAIAIGGGDVAHSGYDVPRQREQLRQIVTAHGLRVDSLHAPFGSESDIATPDVLAPAATGAQGAEGTDGAEPIPDEKRPAPERLAAVSRVKSAIDAAAALDCQIVVIHPTAAFSSEETRSRILALRASLKELIPYAANRNVRLALENVPSLLSMQVFEAALDEFSELMVCHDSSHGQLSTNPFGVLQRFPDRIVTVHISDNQGSEDDHLLPFEGVINWDEWRIYAGRLRHLTAFLLEVEVRKSAYKDTTAFLRQAFERAQRLLR